MASLPETGRPYRSLRSSAEFSRAYKTGTRRRCGAVTVVIAPGPAGPATVGFVVGKRVGSAVLRNRAKRRLREAAARCALKSDTVYVLIADRAVLTAPFAGLVSAINRCTGEESVSEERA
ncbi:MAG: ribonuclease P protein component [Acidimicrobiia bacterium]|nr:ribonuclease P protein component [Acidimicrobiia bacterium]